jgi:ureidoacrylate peracid hydrolase
MDEPPYPQQAIDFIMRRRGRLHIYEDLDPSRTALLVVDMQEAFVAKGAPIETPSARGIVANINHLAATIRDTGGTVVWIISTYGPRPEDDWPTFFDHVMGPQAAASFRGALTEGRDSHRIYGALGVADDDPVVSKNRFGAFVGSGGRLERLLRDKGVDTLLITGTVTNMCCETTAREAAMLSYKTIMVADANAGRSDAEHNATLSAFLQGMGDVYNTRDLVSMLEGGAAAS